MQLTLEEYLEKYPERKDDIEKTMQFISSIPKEQLFQRLHPEKYAMSQVDYATKCTRELFNEKPEMPLRRVLVSVLDKFQDDNLEADLLRKITDKVIEQWEKLTALNVERFELAEAA
jgi:uncharacterized protein YjgD (DUF1641 family)